MDLGLEKKHAAEAIAANLIVELQNSREESRPEPFKLRFRSYNWRQQLVLVEAKDAKAAEQRPVKEINIFSEVGRVLNSKFNGTINMSNENFEAMRAKAKECEDLVEKKEAIVMAELQQMYAKKNEVDRKVETNLKAIEETKAVIETALWSVEMADSAKAAIEIELFMQPDSEVNDLVGEDVRRVDDTNPFLFAISEV
ncbi:hypothetical protein Fmac_005917 [Flemingia macrophylla]|uniref:Uncharacterized protein n=1 Tax=Flemingia macrophylla TaxID=520843 RepID=A0ABD1N945_9FABA